MKPPEIQTYFYTNNGCTYAVIGSTQSIIYWYVRVEPLLRGAKFIGKNTYVDGANIVGCQADRALREAMKSATQLGDPMPDEYQKLRRGLKPYKSPYMEEENNG